MANEDRRGNTLRTTPVYRKELSTITIASGGTTEVTIDESLNGIIGTIVATVNNTTNSVTATLSIRDEDSAVLYSKAAIAENDITVLSGVDVLTAGALTVGVTPSGDPGASTMTVDLVFYVV